MHTIKVAVTVTLLVNLSLAFLDNGTRDFRSIDDIDDSPALRIVRGRNARPGEVPYQISFKRKLNWRTLYTFCGGTLINRNTVISAAHCFVKKKMCDFCSKGRLSKSDLKHYWAIAGTYKTQDRLKGSGQWRKLVKVNYPKLYKFPTDDIAIVKLSYGVRYNRDVQPIKYARGPLHLDGQTCIASGFGRLSIGKTKSPTYLQVGDVVIMNQKLCNKWHRKNMNKFICTNDVKSDIAEGDSGGPLVCKLGGKGESEWGSLVGVVCGRTTKQRNKHSSYFTRVTSFTRFLAAGGRGPRSQQNPVLLVYFCLCISFYFV